MDRLTQTVDCLREEIDMFETQCVAQLEETKAAQKALSEATTEIEVNIADESIKFNNYKDSLLRVTSSCNLAITSGKKHGQ